MILKTIHQRLTKNFESDAEIEIIDTRKDQSHIEIVISSRQFNEKTRIQRHQMVYELISDYLADGTLHAVKMNLSPKNEN